MTIERPGHLKPVHARSIAALPRAASTGQDVRKDQAPSASQARPRRSHVLHGWRLLAGPLVVQVLQNGYEVPPHIPAEHALRHYRPQPARTLPVLRKTA